MAEYVKATRPDGSTVEVSRKAFDLIYREQGYTEGEGTKNTGDVQNDYVAETSTKPKPKRKATLTRDVTVNAPEKDD